MSYKTILTPIMFAETADSVLKSAFMVAGTFNSHVHAKHIRQPFTFYPPATYYPMMSSDMSVTAEADEKAATEQAEALRAIFDETCNSSGVHYVPLAEALHQNGVTASWSDDHGSAYHAYGSFGRVCDLSIVALPSKQSATLETAVFEGLLMASGRPVLLTPRDGLQTVVNKVLVAWDGSLPAARAISAAMPFLEQADEVVVATIGEVDLGAPDCSDAVQFLERRGVKAIAKEVDWPKKPVAERILNQAEANNCDLVVMGGYSHARLFESILGGVTHHMLKHANMPVLMAH